MAYDHMGRRVRYVEMTGGITNKISTFLYDGYLCIARTADGVTDRFLWDPTEPVATRPLAMVADGTTYLYVHDANKNVSELVNARTGETAAHYDYSAFGKTLILAGPLAHRNPFRFSSEYADDATGLTYYNWRHYDPVHGRWLSEDPKGIEGGINLYSAYHNNSICNIDLKGLGLFSWVRSLKCGENAEIRREADYLDDIRDVDVAGRTTVEINVAGPKLFGYPGEGDSGTLISHSYDSWITWGLVNNKTEIIRAMRNGYKVSCRRKYEYVVQCACYCGKEKKHDWEERYDTTYFYGRLGWDDLAGRPYCECKDMKGFRNQQKQKYWSRACSLK